MSQSNSPVNVIIFQLTTDLCHICSKSLVRTHILIVILNIILEEELPQSQTIYLD